MCWLSFSPKFSVSFLYGYKLLFSLLEKKRQFISGKFQQCLHESPERGSQHDLSAAAQQCKLQVDHRLLGFLASKCLWEILTAIKPRGAPWCWRNAWCWALQPPARKQIAMMETSLQFSVSLLNSQGSTNHSRCDGPPFSDQKKKKKRKKYGLTGEYPTHSILGMARNSLLLDFLLFFDLQENTALELRRPEQHAPVS